MLKDSGVQLIAFNIYSYTNCKRDLFQKKSLKLWDYCVSHVCWPTRYSSGGVTVKKESCGTYI
jgi:hypothetical protein